METFDSSLGISVRKSAKDCPFILVLGLYQISYSPNSISHLANRPDRSDCKSTCLISWLVSTQMGWAWNYLRRRQVVCTNTKKFFPTEGNCSQDLVSSGLQNKLASGSCLDFPITPYLRPFIQLLDTW